MNQYLVEHYWPGCTPESVHRAADRVRSSVDEMAREGSGIRYVRSTTVPRDEMVLLAFAADSSALVEEAYSRAGVAFDRIVDALEET